MDIFLGVVAFLVFCWLFVQAHKEAGQTKSFGFGFLVGVVQLGSLLGMALSLSFLVLRLAVWLADNNAAA